MRKTIKNLSIFFIIMAFSTSCNSGAGKKLKEAKDQLKNTTNMIKSLSKVEKESEDISANMEALKGKEPFSNDKFKDWMPESLNGLERTSFQFSSSMGNSGKMEFTDNANDKKFKINIIDGAGESGSIVYASQSFITGFMSDYESESDTKAEKIVNRKGSKALQTVYKNDNKCTIKATIDDRFIIDVESKNIGLDDTWQMIDNLNIGKLK